MGAVCKACRHPQTETISLELLQQVPMREIADKYGLSLSCVARHKKHVPTSLAKTQEAQQVAEAGSVMQKIIELDRRVDEIYTQATEAKEPVLALKALKEMRGITELYAKLAGEISNAKTVNNIIITPEWAAMRAVMLRALEPYPEARPGIGVGSGRCGNCSRMIWCGRLTPWSSPGI